MFKSVFAWSRNVQLKFRLSYDKLLQRPLFVANYDIS